MMEFYVNAFAFLALILQNVLADIIGPNDYCLLDSFEPKCNQGQVVLIESALYGRMKPGKCFPEGEGNLGCFSDVRSIVDYHCSGRQSCAISPLNRDLVATKPCGETVGYIAVSYQCISAANNRVQCGPSNKIEITQNEGFIAAPSANSPNCPVVIKAPSGKLVNISVYNFMKSKTHSACYEVAVIKEKESRKSIHVCPTDARVKEVYVSSGHDVLIEPSNLEKGGAAGSYLFKFEASGCPLPMIPADAHMERNGDRAKVICNDSDNSWFIYCKNNQWTGQDRNCPKDWGISTIFKTEKNSFPYGIFLTSFIGVGIGIFIGGFLLFLAINAFQRHQRRLRQMYEAPPVIPDPDYKIYDSSKMDFTLVPGFATGRHTISRHQMSPPPIPSQPPEDERRFSRHTYEKPKYNSTDNQQYMEA